jgi:major membrane immunogen (membrane-anchored lipoprotein)
MKTVKRILATLMMCLTIVAVSTLMTGCVKEDCTCGIIANDGIDDGCYWLEIRNDCTGNKRKFCFDQDIWTTSHVGESFCVIGEVSW